ncbi:MAG TPA: biotin/lipoyl-containing protein [Gemmatimonadaceae bacterium]|nr:biotin/lipoyl-containing protein [Gemmatimonadaceae bacterium]
MSVDGEAVEVEVTPEGVRVDGELVQAVLTPVAGTPLVTLTLDASVHALAVRPGEGRGRFALWTSERRFEVEALDERTRTIRELAAANRAAEGPAPLVAPMPGLIVRISVAPGDAVQPGQGLVVMEAMKMENELRAPAAGTVTAVRVAPGNAVEKGAILVELASLPAP